MASRDYRSDLVRWVTRRQTADRRCRGTQPAATERGRITGSAEQSPIRISSSLATVTTRVRFIAHAYWAFFAGSTPPTPAVRPTDTRPDHPRRVTHESNATLATYLCDGQTTTTTTTTTTTEEWAGAAVGAGLCTGEAASWDERADGGEGKSVERRRPVGGEECLLGLGQPTTGFAFDKHSRD
uniref:Uncharacterized protein n=1 Tax=Plectus sambesii TaxID=2011161 RepID=A0A914W0Y4_9BILA